MTMQPPRPPGPQCRERDRDGVPRPGQVGVDDVAPHGGGVPTVAEPHDAGVGQDDVDPPERGHALVEGLLQPGQVAHVGLERHDLAAFRLDELCRLVEIGPCGVGVVDRRDVGADVDGQDVGALPGQPDGVRPALPARRSGDECDLAFESSHLAHFSFAG